MTCLKTFKFATILVHHSHQSSLGLEWVVTWVQEHVTSGLTVILLVISQWLYIELLVSASYYMAERSILHGLSGLKTNGSQLQ